jgi:4-hydroxyphenylpyruvate dioxygenase-like putative hemolysin
MQEEEEDIETLAQRVQNLQIALSEAEAHYARKKQDMANKEKDKTKAKAEGRADGVMFAGDHVTIIWDRYWQWNRSTWRMPKTHNEGCRGTVLRTTQCFVWVMLNDTNEVVKKRKHNVKLVTGKK